MLGATTRVQEANLQLARWYLSSLFADGWIAKYLANEHDELRAQLRKVVEATSLERADGVPDERKAGPHAG